MPAVDANTWFDADAGDGLPVKRRPRQDPGFTDPTLGNAIPAAVPAGAPSWDVPAPAPQLSPRRRPADEPPQLFPAAVGALALAWPDTSAFIRRLPWRAAADAGALGLLPPGMTAASAGEKIASQQPPDAFFARPWRPVNEQTALPPLPPGVTTAQLAWDISAPTLHLPRGLRAAELLDLVPIWTFGTGQPVPPDSWGVDSGALSARSRRPFFAPEMALPPLRAVTDVPVTLIGWRDDAPAMRWRRPAFRAQEIAALPPLTFLDVTLWGAAVLALPANLVRARHWQAPAPEDLTPAIWAAWLISIDTQGRMTWASQHNYPRYPRRTAWRDEGAAPVLDTTALLAVPWLPMDDGSRQAARPAWRAFTVPAHAEGLWQALPSVIIVGGPYYVVAGQLWQAGAVDGDVQTAQ